MILEENHWSCEDMFNMLQQASHGFARLARLYRKRSGETFWAEFSAYQLKSQVASRVRVRAARVSAHAGCVSRRA
jgi:hypothetical protein